MKSVARANTRPEATSASSGGRLQKRRPSAFAALEERPCDAHDETDAALQRSLLRSLAKGSPAIAWRGAFYAQLRTHISDVDAYARRRYGEANGANLLRKLRALVPNCEDLIVDPGLVQRIDEFCVFVQTRSYKDARDARQNFSNALGQRSVLRGLALRPQDAAATADNGLPCRGNDMMWSWGAVAAFNDVASMHVANSTKHSPLLSVTLKAKVAKSVSRRHLAAPEQKIFLFELRVPELDIVRSSKFDAEYRGPKHSDETEMFVPFGIHPTEIAGFEQAPTNSGWFQELKQRCKAMALG